MLQFAAFVTFSTREPVNITWPASRVITGQFDNVQTGLISQRSYPTRRSSANASLAEKMDNCTKVTARRSHLLRVEQCSAMSSVKTTKKNTAVPEESQEQNNTISVKEKGGSDGFMSQQRGRSKSGRMKVSERWA